MNTEHLLDAIGLLDDDLIQAAEAYTVRKKWPVYSAWIGLAACLAIVAVLRYGITGMGGSGAANGGSAGNQTAGSPALELPPTGTVGDIENQDSFGGVSNNGTGDSIEQEDPDASAPAPGEGLQEPAYNERIFVTSGGKEYVYGCRLDEVSEDGTQAETPQTDVLPAGCRSLGEVVSLEAEGGPHTDTGRYEGCSLWIQGSGWEGPVYLELPQGGYLIFEYSQTYDLNN